MAEIKITYPKKTTAVLSVTVPATDLKPFLVQAAAELSKTAKIDGFRPGHAPYEEVVKAVGEMAIYEAALETAVRKTYVRALIDHDLSTVGSPNINVTTLAPGNDLVYEATIDLMPNITTVADWKTLSLKASPMMVTDKEVEDALKNLTQMRTAEVRVSAEETAGDQDKVVVDLDMKREGVPIEGGQSKGSYVFMNQESYLPGLREAISGMKEGESKTFELTFPEEHFQKSLAGAKVDVTAEVKEIYHLSPPALDDDFAKSLGLESFEALKSKINENIGIEKEREESVRLEREMLELIAEKSEFEELPESLIEGELDKMLYELKRNVNENGLEFEQYLGSLKKSLEDLKTDLRPQAKRRLEIALLLKEIATTENVTAPEEELDTIIEDIAKDVKDKDTRDRIYSPEYREYQANILRNRRVIELLKQTILKTT